MNATVARGVADVARAPTDPQPLRRARVRLGSLVTIVYFVVVFTMLLAPLVVVIGGSFSAPPNDSVVMS